MDLVKPLTWLVVLVVVLIGMLAVSGSSLRYTGIGSFGNATSEESSGPIVPPLPTEKDTVAAQAGHVFSALVSYTDNGFEPAEVSIVKGDTVRFTNNSRKKQLLWVAAGGTNDVVYPPQTDGCGSSALDSCSALNPGEYWEFTFDVSGTWTLHNNLDKDKIAVVYAKS